MILGMIKQSKRKKISIFNRLKEHIQHLKKAFRPSNKTKILVHSKQAEEETSFPIALSAEIQSVLKKDSIIMEEYDFTDLILKAQIENVISSLDKIDVKIEEKENELKQSEFSKSLLISSSLSSQSNRANF